MAMSAEHRSKFAVLHRYWWRLHMGEKFSSGTINPIQKNPKNNNNNKWYHRQDFLSRRVVSVVIIDLKYMCVTIITFIQFFLWSLMIFSKFIIKVFSKRASTCRWLVSRKYRMNACIFKRLEEKSACNSNKTYIRHDFYLHIFLMWWYFQNSLLMVFKMSIRWL